MILTVTYDTMMYKTFDYQTSNDELHKEIEKQLAYKKEEYNKIEQKINEEIKQLEAKKRTFFNRKNNDKLFQLRISLINKQSDYNREYVSILHNYIKDNYIINDTLAYELNIRDVVYTYELQRNVES